MTGDLGERVANLSPERRALLALRRARAGSRATSAATRNRPILVTGCPRSGTTLLLLALDSHPAIHGVDEDEWDFASLDAYLEHEGYGPCVLLKSPGASHAVEAFRLFPGLSVLWCVRDPRDVVASMLNFTVHSPGQPPASWAASEYAQGQIENSLSVLDACVKEQLSSALETYYRITGRPPAARSRRELVFTGALCWRLKYELVRLYRDGDIPFRLVRYIDLTRDPKGELGQILEFLGLRWDDSVLAHHLLHSGTAIGNTDRTRPIDRSSVGKWKMTLSEEALPVIRELCSGLAQGFGYRL
jgi:hypothetical protein